ncbi:hypothetical protein [uncultured Formosa sp.]|uniref:hypothetical protein n=1 Tax=uncultured Formosa sp. TaxID=255435 RepID=UPI0026336856|nr:hypothetical protein [uncultured Formosa sp.]
MKLILVRISAWFASIFYLIMSIVSLVIMLSEKIEYGIIITFFMFILMSATGWNARKFGSTDFKVKKYSKILGILTLIFGIFFLVFTPIIFASQFGFGKSYVAILTLFILFLPAIISAIAILFGRTKETVEIAE